MKIGEVVHGQIVKVLAGKKKGHAGQVKKFDVENDVVEIMVLGKVVKVAAADIEPENA